MSLWNVRAPQGSEVDQKCRRRDHIRYDWFNVLHNRAVTIHSASMRYGARSSPLRTVHTPLGTCWCTLEALLQHLHALRVVLRLVHPEIILVLHNLCEHSSTKEHHVLTTRRILNAALEVLMHREKGMWETLHSNTPQHVEHKYHDDTVCGNEQQTQCNASMHFTPLCFHGAQQ